MDRMKIKKYDNGDMYNVLKSYPQQIQETLDNYKNISNFKNKFSSIIICGMGGSAISGDLLRTLVYNELSIPIFINRDYSIPKWVSLNTLINFFELTPKIFSSISIVNSQNTFS